MRPVIGRIVKMIEIDDQMIDHMLCHWGSVQDRHLPQEYFDRDRNLRNSDLKLLEKAARQLGDERVLKSVHQATGLLRASSTSTVSRQSRLSSNASIGIELVELDIPGTSTPEAAAYISEDYFRTRRTRAEQSGGMIKTLTLDVLKKYSEFGEIAVRHFVVGQF